MSDDSTERTGGDAERHLLDLAARDGDAYRESVAYAASRGDTAGGVEQAGEFLVGLVQGAATGRYVPTEAGDVEWVEPASANCYLGVAVADAVDRRFVPALSVTATMTPADGADDAVGPFELPFAWHPGHYRYGRNVEVRGSATYDVAVRIDPPSFDRADRANGRRYREPAEVAFRGVDVETGLP